MPDELCRVLEQGLAKAPADRQHDVGPVRAPAPGGAGRARAPDHPAADRVGRRRAPPVAPVRATADADPGLRRPPAPAASASLAAVVLGVAAVVLGRVPLAADRASPLPVLYQDNFDAGQNWYEHDDETARLAYDEGRYRMVVKTPARASSSPTPRSGAACTASR